MSLSEPLLFRPICIPKVWGGSRLSSYLEQAEAPASSGPVGEVWQLVDRDDTSSVVQGGTFDGRTLRGLMLSEREALLGESRASGEGYFPLLVKRIDARSNLSVQVHPDAATAERLKAAEGKAEAWAILEADPGSHLYLGIRDDVDAKSFAESATGPGVVDLLTTYEVEAGQFFYVPPGSVHSIGGGITLLEIQDNSDTTYRLFDWGRAGLDGTPRSMHCEDALKSIDYERQPGGPIQPTFVNGHGEDGPRVARVVDAPSFRINLLELVSGYETDSGGRASILVPLVGGARIERGDESWPLAQGEVALIPASMGAHRLVPEGVELRLLSIEALPEEEK